MVLESPFATQSVVADGVKRVASVVLERVAAPVAFPVRVSPVVRQPPCQGCCLIGVIHVNVEPVRGTTRVICGITGYEWRGRDTVSLRLRKFVLRDSREALGFRFKTTNE